MTEIASAHADTTQQEAKRYQKQKLTLTVVSMVAELIYLAYMAVAGGLVLDRYVAPMVHGNQWYHLWLFAFIFAVGAQLVGLPFDYYGGYYLEHKYALSQESLGHWGAKQFKVAALLFGLGAIILTGLYAILWAIPSWWWVVAGAGWLLLSVVLGQLFPVLIVPLFFKLTPIEDTSLLERFRKWAAGTGVQIKDVLRLSLSQETKKANAALAGLGATKRVLMGDTLLENFSPEEIDAVFVHELGHSVFNHVWKGIALSAVLGFAGFFVCNLVLRELAVLLGHASFTAVSALPLFLLVLSAFSLALSPFEKAISRYFERQADWYSLERTRNPQAFVAAFRRLAELNKADINPSRITVLLFYTHPPISERMAMAHRWQNQAAS